MWLALVVAPYQRYASGDFQLGSGNSTNRLIMARGNYVKLLEAMGKSEAEVRDAMFRLDNDES